MIKEILAVLTLLIALNAYGQNTISPYSIFGPGEIQNKGFGATQGLGGAGIALKSSNSLNNLNPASYTGIDSSRIIAEFGLESKLYNLKTYNTSQTGYTGNFNYLALGFRVTRWMSSSFGIVPFSTIGYSVEKENYIEGVDAKYTSIYTGSGGITQFYIGNAFKIAKNLSIGVNVSYMFGPLIQDENITQTDFVPQLQITRQDFLRSFYFDYGLQYSFEHKKTNYCFGATFSNKQNLKSNHILNVYDATYSNIRSEKFETDYLTVPLTFGVGLGITQERKYKLLVDYNFQKWSGIAYPIQNDNFVNSHSFSLGLEVNPWGESVLNQFYQNWDYRVGFNYKSSYLKFGNDVIRGSSISLGVGVPLPGRISKMNWGFELGTNGTDSNKLIKENYLLFQLGFSLNEIAFIKRRFD
jgi:hypothetical protein